MSVASLTNFTEGDVIRLIRLSIRIMRDLSERIPCHDPDSAALYGLSEALRDYHSDKGASFETFLAMVLKRRIIKEREKFIVNQWAFSEDVYVENTIENEKRQVHDIIGATQAVMLLPPLERVAVTLIYLENVSRGTICHVLDLDYKNLKKLELSALRQLKAILTQEQEAS